ncbi:uncharacterized protein TNIN_271261 [Trichonephila inaurata madagascariensis]|uniref:Uncharacterized protein n=1 Tax=Trichonephila inaurata madagascariensis TaxID=2747483 RepID=A0A8X7CAR8_9ARAC|nr:uncharacterized protein TNIN_271261 [Trichonephila inaurata madagascariensis]
MSVKQKAEGKTNDANECSKETEFKEDKVETLDKKCNKTQKNTRKSLLKENSRIPMRIKGPECPKTTNEKVTMDECVGVPKEESNSKQPKEKDKTFSVVELSKELIHYYKTEQFKTPKNSTKDCMKEMKSLTIDKSCKVSEKKRNHTTLRKSCPNPNAFQESKDISPKILVKTKDSAHSGLTFKPNVMKKTIPKPFKFQSKPKVLARSKSVTESSVESKVKKRFSSVRKIVKVEDQHSKTVKERKAQKSEENSPSTSDKSKTPDASSADSKSVTFKKYSAYGGLRFKPKRVSTQSKGEIFDSVGTKTE